MELSLTEKIEILLLRINRLKKAGQESFYLEDVAQEIKVVELAWTEVKDILRLRSSRIK